MFIKDSNYNFINLFNCDSYEILFLLVSGLFIFIIFLSHILTMKGSSNVCIVSLIIYFLFFLLFFYLLIKQAGNFCANQPYYEACILISIKHNHSFHFYSVLIMSHVWFFSIFCIFCLFCICFIFWIRFFVSYSVFTKTFLALVFLCFSFLFFGKQFLLYFLYCIFNSIGNR